MQTPQAVAFPADTQRIQDVLANVAPSPEEWLAARLDLLAAEKELTRAKDRLDARRRELPVMEVTKDYVFTGPGGPARLVDLFEDRRQLVVYHFMWRPDEDAGCPSCSVVADSIGDLSHLNACDTTLALVTRAPLADIQRYRQRMGWQAPWYSSDGSDFNYDFHVSFDDQRGPLSYNYLDADTLERKGLTSYIRSGADAHGASVFLRDDSGRVFHTYSAYGRGLEQLISAYHYLDLTPLGRQAHISQFPRHDAYPAGA